MIKARGKILIILHQETSTPGRVGRLLEQLGFELDIRRPRFGDPLPDRMDEHAGAVIFGGPMSANDPDDFVKQEIDWIKVPLEAKKPFLGICLGAQMMAKQLGAQVETHPLDLVEIGYYPIEPTKQGEGLLDWPGKVYQWHREGFSLPTGADCLASGHYFPNQAMRFGPSAYGIQFHPEVTLQMMHRWTTIASERLSLAGAKRKGDHFREFSLYDPDVERWLAGFLSNWLSLAATEGV